jgi:hypothetical protein
MAEFAARTSDLRPGRFLAHEDVLVVPGKEFWSGARGQIVGQCEGIAVLGVIFASILEFLFDSVADFEAVIRITVM